MNAPQYNRKYGVTVDAKLNALGSSYKGATLAYPRDLKPGDMLSMWVEEDDTWQLSASRSFGADGNKDKSVAYPSNAGPFAYSNGGLVGSLNDGATYFPVGGWLQMGVPTSGTLKLYNWDTQADDNQGKLNVVIGVQPYRANSLRVRRARAAKWNSFTVDAYQHFSGGSSGCDTNVTVNPGDILQVAVSDEDLWTLDDESLCSANGKDFVDGAPASVNAGAGDAFQFPIGALIGTLDGGKTYFFVGNHLEMTALGTGSLTLFCANDGRSGNQQSALEAKRTLTAYVHVIPRGTYRGVLFR